MSLQNNAAAVREDNPENDGSGVPVVQELPTVTTDMEPPVSGKGVETIVVDVDPTDVVKMERPSPHENCHGIQSGLWYRVVTKPTSGPSERTIGISFHRFHGGAIKVEPIACAKVEPPCSSTRPHSRPTTSTVPAARVQEMLTPHEDETQAHATSTEIKKISGSCPDGSDKNKERKMKSKKVKKVKLDLE